MFKQIINITKSSNTNTDDLKKKRNKSTPNLFYKEEPTKTSGYYQKLYSLNPSRETINTQDKNKNQSPKKISLKNVFKPPNYPKPEFQFRKITNAKWPFSLKKSESKESIKERIKLSRPSKLFHNFTNIQWLRRKFPESVINKSIYTLLPNNGKPVVPDDESEEDKRHRLMIEYLESLKGPMGRDQYININPKYFFNKQTWETVLKLKQIFLDFDEDGNRRMELDEMQEMFESNKIFASINDLVDLFFKGKKFKEKDIMKLYLNFHQFINFALTKDQEFREFMRNIKEKAEKKSEEKKLKTGSNNNQNDIISEHSEEEEKNKMNESDEEKGQYLPMNFKSLLDYFVDRGKQRESKGIINKAIKEMNEVINMNLKKKNKEKKQTNLKERRGSINSEKIFNSQKTPKMNEEESNTSNNSNNKVSIIRRKTLLTQKTIIPNKFKSFLKNLKNITKSNKKLIDDDLDKMELDLEEEEELKIDYEKQLHEVDFNKLINEFSNLFSVSQLPKKIVKKEKTISNLKSQVKKENKKEEKEVKEIENKNKKKLIKNSSSSFLNTVLTRTKENTLNIKTNKNVLVKSNTALNIKPSIIKKKEFTLNNYKSIDKNINVPISHSYFRRNIEAKDNSFGNFKKILFDKDVKNSLNPNVPKFLEDINDNNKNVYLINDYMGKTKLPMLKNNTTKYNRNSFHYSLSNNKKRKINYFIYNKEALNFNQSQKKKIRLDLYKGQLNLIKNDIDIKLPKSNNSKLDYVPFGLLFDKGKKC